MNPQKAFIATYTKSPAPLSRAPRTRFSRLCPGCRATAPPRLDASRGSCGDPTLKGPRMPYSGRSQGQKCGKGHISFEAGCYLLATFCLRGLTCRFCLFPQGCGAVMGFRRGCRRRSHFTGRLQGSMYMLAGAIKPSGSSKP